VLTRPEVRALVGANVPVHRLLLGDEFDTWAIGEERVAKFALTDNDAAKLPLEVRLHPLLREILGEVVPAIRDVRWRDGDDLGHIVYDRASGKQGQDDDGASIQPAAGLAEHLGQLLALAHAVDATTARSFGVGDRIVSLEMPTLDEQTMAIAARAVGDRLEAFLSTDPPAPSGRRVLCHTDLKGEHVFVAEDRDRVTAIIDWADAEVSDPALDHAGLVIWLGPAFTAAAVAASGEHDDSLHERAVWLARAGMLRYWSDMLAGRGHAPVDLVTKQLKTAFGD
jgi:aminoglycoside phosphotransferase (APT) family kinase protein